MNPNESNPSSPTGAGSATGGLNPTPTTSSVPSPVDFTNPSSLNTNTSSLSMADSLASAQENLTSAGQAADTGASSAMGLDQLGSASATMARPDEALTPADPVPGSIGSVTSVPPLAAEPMDMGAFGGASTANTSASAMPGSAAASATTGQSTPAASTMFGTGSAAATPTATSGTASTANTATPDVATTTKPVQPYYNPFARTMGNAAPTSSTNVPPALQPQTEKFSARMAAGMGAEKKKSNIMSLLGWLMAVLFAVTTIVFLMLWMDAKNNPKIIYRDPEPVGPSEPVTDTVSLMTCTQDFGNPVVEGLENLTGDRKEVSLRFVNGALNKVDLSNIYTFVDDAAAEVARGYFDGQNNWYNDIAANAGVTAITTNLNIEGPVARQDLSATAENLVGDYLGIFSLSANEEGNVDLSEEGIRQAYTNGGFICTVE